MVTVMLNVIAVILLAAIAIALAIAVAIVTESNDHCNTTINI